MRIAYVVGPFPAISETFVVDQIRAMIDRGHDVDIFAWPSGEAYPTELLRRYQLQARTYYCPDTGPSLIRRLRAAAELLRRAPPGCHRRILSLMNLRKYGRAALSLRLVVSAVPHVGKPPYSYDVVHSHFASIGLQSAALKAAGFLRAASFVTSFHGRDVHVDLAKMPPRIRSVLFASQDLLTVNSSFTARRLVQLGARTDKVFVQPMGIDVSGISFRPRSLDEDRVVRVLSVGRLVEKKGLSYAIDAVSRVARDAPIEYRIVGDGPLRQDLSCRIRSNAMGHVISLLGALPFDAVQRQYDWTDLFLLPSATARDGDKEGQGVVLLEAQAAGIPVITTRHNGFPDSVDADHSAILVSEANVDELEAAIRELVTSPERWPVMGRCGRSFVSREFDNTNLVDSLETVYQQRATTET